MSRATRRRDGDRGASLVEAAVVAPVILLIVFSIIELAFAYRSASVTATAARAGARLAASTYGEAETAAERVAARDAIATAVNVALGDLRDEATPVKLLVYEANASGRPLSDSYAVCGASCMRFDWNSGAQQFQYSGGSWNDADNCGQVIDRVGVYIEATHRPTAPIVNLSITIDETTVMRLEPGAFSLCTTE